MAGPSRQQPPPLPTERPQPPPLPGERPPTRLAKPLRPFGRRPQKPTILNPEELERYRNLLVFARSKVEGYFVGRHKSPDHGSSSEFADYKKYTPGDDLQHLDWKVWGRSRRLFIRQFEEETDMTVYLLVDISRSMAYQGGASSPKALLAARIAAALSYLMLKQGDQVALGLYDEKLTEYISPGGTHRKLNEIVTTLERVTPTRRTALASALEQAEAVFRQRGRVVILSDFLDDMDGVLDALGRLLHRRFEVLLMQILDPHERELPPGGVARYEDLETGETMRVDPAELRAAYRQRMRDFVRELQAAAVQRTIDHHLVDAAEPYHSAIEAYLGFRRPQNR